MKKDVLIKILIGAILIILIATCSFLFIRRDANISSSKNIEQDVSNESTNQNISFEDVINDVKKNISSDLKESKIENNPYNDAKVYIADTKDEYTEIWLVDKSDVQDINSVYDEIKNRTQDIKFENYQNEEEDIFENPENIIVRQDAGKVIAIVSNKASAIESSINNYISQNAINTIISNSGKIEVGDYVEYTSEKNENVAWRIWSIDEINKKVVIIPTEPLGKLSFYGINGDDTRAGWVDAEKKIEELCDEYKNGKLGITANDVRSIKLEDIKQVVNNIFTGTDEIFTFEEGYFYEYLKNPTDQNNTISQIPVIATLDNPVSVRIKFIPRDWFWKTISWKELNNQKNNLENQTFGDFFKITGWVNNKVASEREEIVGTTRDSNHEDESDATDYIKYIGVCLVGSYYRSDSTYDLDMGYPPYIINKYDHAIVTYYDYEPGPRETPEYGVRPLVTIDMEKIIDNNSGAVSGTESNPWKIQVIEPNYQDNFGTYYSTLADAFTKAPSGSTVTALKDVAESKSATLVSSKAVTLDLNGKTINVNMTSGNSFIINSGNLTIKDSKANGKINIATAQYAINNSSIFTMENGTLESSANYTIYANGTGKVTIKNGIINNTRNTAIMLENGAMETIIDGGTITGKIIGITHKTDSDLTVNGGTITGKGTRGIQSQKGGNVIINNGKIEGGTTAIIKSGGSTGDIIVNDGTIIGGPKASNSDGKGIHMNGTGSVTINGGNITACNDAVSVVKTGKNLTITGGKLRVKYDPTYSTGINATTGKEDDRAHQGDGVDFEGSGNLSVSGVGTEIISDTQFGINFKGSGMCTLSDVTVKSPKNAVRVETNEGSSEGGLIIKSGTYETTGESEDKHWELNKPGECAGARINTTGKITIGVKGEGVSKTSPTIIGKSYGLIIYTGNVSFYDGIIKGKEDSLGKFVDDTNVTVDASIINVVEEGYNLTHTYREPYKNSFLVAANYTDDKFYYETLDEAFGCIDNNVTIRALKDVNETTEAILEKNRNITLNLDGKNITVNSPVTGNFITNNGNLKIIDSSSNKTGKITSSYASTIIQNNGSLSIESGQLSGKTYGIYLKPTGELVLGTKGGVVDTENPSIIGGDYGIYIEDGTFKFYDGILKGKTGAFSGNVAEAEPRYDVYYDTEEDYKTAYLKILTAIKAPTKTDKIYNGTQQVGILEGEGYTLVGDAVATNAGEYSVTVKLNDGYKWDNGSQSDLSITWHISAKSIPVIWDETTTWVYDGNSHIPTATAPTEITNETISLSITGEITDVGNGTATASISGVSGGQGRIENYTLTNTTKNFTITRLGIARPTASDKTYNRAEQSGVPEGTGYTLGGQVKGINAGPYTTTVTLDKNHKWSTGAETEVLSLSWKINPKTITAEMVELAYSTTVYTGSALQPGVTVKDGVATLVNPDEYTVAYTENTNVGTATVTITGIGNYTGTPTKTFTITRKPIAKPVVTNRIYNRSEQIGVAEGTGYKLSGKTKATDVGSYEVTVTLDSNYKWSDNGTDETADVALTWKIDPKTITAEMIELEYSTAVYTGSALQPKVTVVDGTATLINPTEYTVTYANNTNVGTAIVTIAGTGNYTGTPTVEFTITRKGIDVPTGTDYIYDGSYRTGVKESVEYTITGTASAIDAGTYTATVKPTSNYQWKDGTSEGKNITWKIAQKSIEVTWEGVFTWQYDGTPHIPTATAPSGVPNETIILTITTPQTNVGDYIATASISKVNGGQGRIENYVLTNTTKPFKITQREIAVIWLPDQDKYEYTYNGQLQGPDVQTEVESALGEVITFGVRGKEKDAGSYTAEAYIVSITNGVAENYKVSNTTKAFVINRKDITVKANANQGKGPGEPEPDLTFTYEGNIAGEIPGFTGSLAREEGEGGGRYRIRRGTLELADTDTFKAGNYNLIFIDEDTEFVISYDKEKELILVFKITDTNNKLILPIPASTSNDYIVIWGDNNSDMYTKEGFPEHTYEKAGTYTVEIGGIVKNFGYYNSLRPTESNIYKDYLNYTNQLTGIEQLGDVDAERIGFAFCENLTGNVPEANLDLSDLVSAENMFNNCVLLQGPIPTNLLTGAEKVNSAKNMFLNCENLTGTIPANLFADTKEITTFESTFNNCKKLDGAIPAELFVNGENVTTYAGTFKDCANLDGEIPAELFGNSRRVTTFKETFSNCTGLNTTISPKLFGTNPYVRNYYRTFYNCTGITGTIDENVFGSNVLITEIPDKDLNSNFKQTFENCTGITDVRLISLVIGKEMFKDCTSIKSLKLEKTIDIGEKAFEGCNSLTQIEANNDYLRTIGIDAFEYTGTNPEKLLTKINRENELLLNYIWNDDNRLIDVEPPKGTVEIITQKDPYTNNENVTLKITVEDNYSEPSNCKMVIMNEREYNEFANREYKDYDSLPWQDYAETVAWTLTSNDDLKTVYVLFKDEFGNANVVKDIIN